MPLPTASSRVTARRIGTVVLVIAALAGCGSSVDSTPEKLDGTESYEFEQEDIDAAEEASDEVKDYCSDAVSEAQRVGCEAHVTDDEVP